MAMLKLGNLEFEWDDMKAATNLSKQGVSFPEAATAFLDAYAEMIADVDHSEEEDRFILIATSARLRILTGNACCARLAAADHQCAARYSE